MIRKKGFERIISPDLAARSFRKMGEPKWQHSTIIHPGELSEVRLDRQFIKPMHESGYHPQVEVGTRSVLARLGMELFATMESVHELKTPAQLIIMNHGEVPIRLQQGNRIGRFSFSMLAKNVPPSEIKKRMESGELVLNKGFRFLKSGMIEITPQKVVWTIPEEARKIIEKENWAAGSKRKKLMELLQRAERAPKTHPQLGRIILTETSPVALPPDMALFFYKTTTGKSAHIHSLIIDPGFRGPIVLELASMQPKVTPDKILARLVHVPEY